MDDKKYICFVWRTDDEGGYGVCPVEDFNPRTFYDPSSGPHAQLSQCIGYFDTVSELAEILYEDGAPLYDYLISHNIRTPLEDAEKLMETFELL